MIVTAEPQGGGGWLAAPQSTPVADIAQKIEAGWNFVRTLPNVLNRALIGSAGYLPGQARDIDFLLLIEGATATEYLAQLGEAGFTHCAPGLYPDDEWGATRREDLNLIVTHDPEFFKCRLRAYEVCKYLRIEDRPTRVAIHEIVGDGKSADEIATPGSAK